MIPSTTNAGAGPPARVLVVDDDRVCRDYLQGILENQGCSVVNVDGAGAAQAQLMNDGFPAYDCVVTDYWMPGRTGLDLLAWVREKDSCLTMIMVTAVEEKELIAESLRGGAVDFLDKPVDPRRLLAAISRAATRTRHQRQLADIQSAVHNLGRTQESMLLNPAAHGAARVDLCYRPKLEAGGDFFSYHFPREDEFFCLLTDVSGHDLQAAYISAYFQGVVRGMLARGAGATEIFRFFNKFLLEEWKQFPGLQHTAPAMSVATCSVHLHLRSGLARIVTCGTPAPLYIQPDGRARPIGASGGMPLGWFDDIQLDSVEQAIDPAGVLLLWTDGLEDLAKATGAPAPAIAFALQQFVPNSDATALLDRAADDILLARIHLSRSQAPAEIFHPLLVEEYRGSQAPEIDALLSDCHKALDQALPGLAPAIQHDLLLASREALLNAMRHGCRLSADLPVRFQVSYQPAQQLLRVWVEDPGPGHNADRALAAELSAADLEIRGRGLLLMERLADRLAFERNGAFVVMDFNTARDESLSPRRETSELQML